MLSDSSSASSALATVVAEPDIDTANILIDAMRHIFALRHTRPSGLLPPGPVRAMAERALTMPCPEDPVLGTLYDIIDLHLHGTQSPSPTVQRMAVSVGDLHIQDIELQRRGLNREQRRDLMPWLRYASMVSEPAPEGAAAVSTLTHQ